MAQTPAPPVLAHGAPPLEQVDALVEAAARTHGHLCPGQVIGVRISICGLGLLGYSCPLSWPDIKNLVGFVEVERCLADAVATASGLRFGRGSLKLVNLGLLAACFLDMSSGRAVRLISREEARSLAPDYAPGVEGLHQAQTQAYRIMPDDVLFEAAWVKVDLKPEDMPGARPLKVVCAGCGAIVRSGQAVEDGNGQPICPVCAGKAYFSFLPTEAQHD